MRSGVISVGLAFEVEHQPVPQGGVGRGGDVGRQ